MEARAGAPTAKCVSDSGEELGPRLGSRRGGREEEPSEENSPPWQLARERGARTVALTTPRSRGGGADVKPPGLGPEPRRRLKG